MDEKPKKPVASTAVDPTKRGRSLIISIGPQHYEVGVTIEIKPLRNQPAQVIPISGDTPVLKRRVPKSAN